MRYIAVQTKPGDAAVCMEIHVYWTYLHPEFMKLSRLNRTVTSSYLPNTRRQVM